MSQLPNETKSCIFHKNQCRKCHCEPNIDLATYQTQNFRRYHIPNSVKQISVHCPTVQYQDTYGSWSTMDGKYIEIDSVIRYRPLIKNKKRDFRTDHYQQSFYKNSKNTNQESNLQMTKIHNKSKNDQTSFLPYTTSILPKNPQDTRHIIPPHPRNGGWIHSGMDTRHLEM